MTKKISRPPHRRKRTVKHAKAAVSAATSNPPQEELATTYPTGQKLIKETEIGNYYAAKAKFRETTSNYHIKWTSGKQYDQLVKDYLAKQDKTQLASNKKKDKQLEFIPKSEENDSPTAFIDLSATRKFFELSANGLTIDLFLSLTKTWPFTDAQWSSFLDISKRTFIRRIESQQTFSEHESSQILSIIDLVHFGFHVFNDEENFFGWLSEPIMALKWEKPIEYLTNTYGIEIVQQIMSRILYGIHT